MSRLLNTTNVSELNAPTWTLWVYVKGVFPYDLHVGLAVIDSPEVAALIDSAGITLGSANRQDATISLLIRK